jgi:hypothetical protein
MLFLTAFGALALAQGALGKEQAQNMQMAAQLYDSGLMMDRIMQKKQVSIPMVFDVARSEERTNYYYLVFNIWRLTKLNRETGLRKMP